MEMFRFPFFLIYNSDLTRCLMRNVRNFFGGNMHEPFPLYQENTKGKGTISWTKAAKVQ